MQTQTDKNGSNPSFAKVIFHPYESPCRRPKTDYCATAVVDTCIERLEYASCQQLLELHIYHKEKQEKELPSMVQQERYQSLTGNYPAIAQEPIQKRDIAHLRGMTPKTLGRIRRLEYTDKFP